MALEVREPGCRGGGKEAALEMRNSAPKPGHKDPKWPQEDDALALNGEGGHWGRKA